MSEPNRLAHSNKPGEAARRAAEATANIRPQTPEEKARTDQQVLEGKLRAFGSLEEHNRHQILAQIPLPRMLVHMEILFAENLSEADEIVARWVGEQ